MHKHVETFATTTQGLLALADWLHEHVVVESTGVYWKPVWHVLEDDFDVALANANHVRSFPGRKTDVNDATWLAELRAHGLIRPGFVSRTSIQDIRGLTRARKKLERKRARQVQRMQKTLEDANVKLTSVIADAADP